MLRYFKIICFVLCVKFDVFAQPIHVYISPELTICKNTYGGLNMLISNVSKDTSLLHGLILGLEYSKFNSEKIWIPRLGYEFDYKLLSSRLSLLKFSHRNGLVLLPEIGLKFKRKYTVYYGYGFDLKNKNEFNGHSIGINANFDITLFFVAIIITSIMITDSR